MKSIQDCIEVLSCLEDDLEVIVYKEYFQSAQEYLKRYKSILNRQNDKTLEELINELDTTEPSEMRKIREGFNVDLKRVNRR